MAGSFSVYKATGLLFGVLLWLTAGRAVAEALPLPPPEAAGAPFLRFSLSDPVDPWDGSATADFFLWDGDRPVPKEEIDVLAAVCRCRAEEEPHVLPLTVREEEENAAFRLVLPRRAACNIPLKLRYRGQLYVVQALRPVYARGRDPADWPEDAAMPADTPYLEAETEEDYNFRTGSPMSFILQQGEGRSAAVAVYDKDRRLLETLTVGDRFTYEVTPPPAQGAGARNTERGVFRRAFGGR